MTLTSRNQATIHDDDDDDDEEEEECWVTDDPLEKGPASKDGTATDESDEAAAHDNNIDSNNHANPVGEEPTTVPASYYYSLPWPLRILFSFNGVTLALPSTALMYMVNDVVAMPVSLLPTYAAIAFLPCSLRPLYALLNACLQPYLRRDQLLAILLVANALSIGATAWIPNHGVALCFVLAFGRGVTSSWAEFLLGLVLLQRVKKKERHLTRSEEQDQASAASPTATTGTAASVFQAQAATARNVGSLVSYATAGLFFALVEPQLNRRSAGTLLCLAGLVHIVGAFLALVSRMGVVEDNNDNDNEACAMTNPTTATASCSSARWDRTRRYSHRDRSSYHPVGSSEADLEGDIAEAEGLALVPTSPRSCTLEMDQARPNPLVPFCDSTVRDPRPLSPPRASPAASSSSTQTFYMVLALQISLILLTTRQPIVDATTPMVWIALMIAALAVLLTSGCYDYVVSLHWDATHRIGLFLILRHAIPSSTYLLDSYVYALLQDHPLLLQVLSVHTMGFSTLAAWSYGKLWSPGISTMHLYGVMAITTILASVSSLSQMVYVNLAPRLNLLPQVVVIALVQSLVTVTGEWRFLPDVVLATIGAVDAASLTPPNAPSSSSSSRGNSSFSHEELPHREEVSRAALTSSNAGTSQTATGQDDEGEMQYGTLISCIDFGGQVGALLAGPLVTAFQVERENDWAHLDALVGCTSILGVLSLLFLLVLPGARLPHTSCPSY